MYLQYEFQKAFMFAYLITTTSITSFGFEKNNHEQTDQVSKTSVYSKHISKVANLWTVLTNNGNIGDQTFQKPSFEWPGGSGNHHMY